MDQNEAKEAAAVAKQRDQVAAHTQGLKIRFLGARAFLSEQGYPADLLHETAIQHALRTL